MMPCQNVSPSRQRSAGHAPVLLVRVKIQNSTSHPWRLLPGADYASFALRRAAAMLLITMYNPTAAITVPTTNNCSPACVFV